MLITRRRVAVKTKLFDSFIMYYLQHFVNTENIAILAASLIEQTGAQKSEITIVYDQLLSSTVEYKVIIHPYFHYFTV